MAGVMTRRLKLRKDGAEHDVAVRVFLPVADGAAWDCRWEIDWPDGRRANAGRGGDAVQALLHALMMIGAELHCSDAHKAGRLTWGQEWRGYGFPVSPDLRDLLAGDDARSL